MYHISVHHFFLCLNNILLYACITFCLLVSWILSCPYLNSDELWCYEHPCASGNMFPMLCSCAHRSGILVSYGNSQFSSVHFGHSVVSNSLWPHELQHARPPYPFTNFWNLPKLMFIQSVIPSSHLILCWPLLLLTPNPSQHQNLFQWVSSLHEVAIVLEFQL